MGLLDESMAIDARYGFMDSDAFAESITYTPKGGAAQTINAIVERGQWIELDGGVKQPIIRLFVPKSADATVGVASVTKGGDVVSVSPVVGGAARQFTVSEIDQQDNSGWSLILV